MFGILPLISGSIIVTIGAALIAVPFGIGTAVYISEIARVGCVKFSPLGGTAWRTSLRVLGFLGIPVVSPNLRILLDLPTGLTALPDRCSGGIAVPTVVSGRRCARCRRAFT